MNVTDATVLNLTTTYRLNEQETYIVAEMLRHSNREKVLVEIESYKNLKNSLGNQKEKSSFLQLSGSSLKAEYEQLKKKLLTALIDFECHLHFTIQATSSTFTSRTSKSSNFLKSRKTSCNLVLLIKHFGGPDFQEF